MKRPEPRKELWPVVLRALALRVYACQRLFIRTYFFSASKALTLSMTAKASAM